MTTQNKEPAGFTRVDLLASLVMAGLLAILAPGLFGGGARQADEAVCLDNLGRLTRGWLMYAADYGGYLPPNPDTGSILAGKTWVPGQGGVGGGQEFDTQVLADVSRSLIYSYVDKDVRVYRCPADTRRGNFRPSGGLPVPDSPAARSVAANVAVGTDPESAGGKKATDGAWLDNVHNNKANAPWRTYGKLDDVIAPGPAGLFLLLDEDEYSLNDAVLAVGMVNAEWVDWPGTRHDLGATISFVDGHAELHRWTDSRTVVVNGLVARKPVPGSEDYTWLSQRTSARAY